MQNVLHKIESIKSIFVDTQAFSEKNNDIDALLQFLENIEPEFRSIGYEAASMSIALNDLDSHKNLVAWHAFAKGPALGHAAQVHIGLGWAIAKMKLSFLSLADKIYEKYFYRIADGCGYYDGFFRNRYAAVNELPGYMPIESKDFYYQGIGRSFWYSANGDIKKVCDRIANFQEDLHADLWRGIGIAVAYVGGCDVDILEKIFETANMHQVQLASGAALAAQSRIEAGTIAPDTNVCCRLWFELCCEANLISINKTAADTENIYSNWVLTTTNNLSRSFKKQIQ